MSLYIDKFYSPESRAPGKIILKIPVINSKENYKDIAGIMLTEPTFTSSNKWGTILGDVTSDLNDLQSLLGSPNMFSWIGASVMCWKGTEPLKFNADFFAVNYSPNLGLEEAIKSLMALTSLSSGDYAESVTVKVHGGYQPKVLYNNEEQTFNGIVKDNQDMKAEGQFLAGGGITPGTVIVCIGERITLTNLLVSSVNVTPSLVEVCSVNGDNVKPLYYKINVSFIGSRAFLKTDVDHFIKEL